MTTQEIRQKVEELVTPILDRREAFLLEISVKFERGARVIQVFADTDRGITIDECAEISRDLSSAIETDSVLGALSYRLEVSSPGLDRPLKLLRQYQKNIGRKFRVKLRSDAGSSLMTGTLLAVTGDQITFQQVNGEEVTLPFDQIVESKEELPW